MNTKRLQEKFINLVKIDSPTGEEEAVANHILAFLNNLEIQSRLDSNGNVLGHLGEGEQRVLLTAHLDTVEPGRNIQPKIENGIIKTDGTTILGADNKAAIAAILETIEVLVKEKIPHRAIDLLFTVSEESGNTGAQSVDLNQISARKGYSFDSVSPIGTIVTAAPFYYRFNIQIIGKPAHASVPNQAINALIVATRAINQIKMGAVDESTLINIGVINGGNVRNTVCGEVNLQGEIRTFFDERAAIYADEIQQAFAIEAYKIGAKIDFELVKENDGYFYDSQDPEIQLIQQIMDNLQVKANPTQAWGCADANIFAGRGIKVINLGDGVMHAHTGQEQIRVKDLILMTEIILKLIAFR